MGALTDSRKRHSADQRLLPSFPPSPKKPKLAPLPASPAPPLLTSSPDLPAAPSSAPGSFSSSTVTSAATSTSTATASTSSSFTHRPRLPPQPSPPRHYHGPVRGHRAFRPSFARLYPNSPSYSPSKPPPPPQALALEQYVELVNSVARPPPPTCSADVLRGAEATAEVVVVDDGEDIKEDEEHHVDEEEVVETVVAGRLPLYKELLEASRSKHDGKLRTLAFEVRFLEKDRLGLEQLAEVLRDIAPKKEEEVHQPFIPLTDEDEDRVRHALGGGNRGDRLAVHEASNIVITREILQCLNDREWLNDEVINLFLELLKERELREPRKFLKCHFFNTFFYKKLITSGYDYKSVRRWTTKRKLGYSLIECDKIFVPIHKEVHWCLAVINMRDKKFQYLDSLGAIDKKVMSTLARYLVDEAKDKSGQQIDVLSWMMEGVKNLPLQENGWDCGMFMLKYMDFYSRDMDLIFGQKDMRYFRKRTAKEILNLRAE